MLAHGRTRLNAAPARIRYRLQPSERSNLARSAPRFTAHSYDQCSSDDKISLSDGQAERAEQQRGGVGEGLVPASAMHANAANTKVARSHGRFYIVADTGL